MFEAAPNLSGFSVKNSPSRRVLGPFALPSTRFWRKNDIWQNKRREAANRKKILALYGFYQVPCSIVIYVNHYLSFKGEIMSQYDNQLGGRSVKSI